MSTSFPIGPVKGQFTYIPDQDNAVFEGHIRDGVVTAPKLAAGLFNILLLDGADGDPGTYAVPGIAVGDELVFVGLFSTKASIATLEDVTADFTVTAADEITSATDYSNDLLQVFWVKRT
jgi:hypothetical protein